MRTRLPHRRLLALACASLIPLMLVMQRTAVSAGGERAAIGLGRGTTQAMTRQMLDEGFRRNAIPYRTPTFDGLGFAFGRGSSIGAIQRVGRSVIDPTGRIGLFGFNTDVGWTGPRTIYDSEWDDRNPAGGVTASGAIVVFLARYNATLDTWIDTGFIRSGDGGSTWSDFRQVPVPFGSRWYAPYGPLVTLPSGRLMQTFYGSDGGRSYLWAMFSDDDAMSWTRSVDIADSLGLKISEPTAVVVSGTRDWRARLLLVARAEPRVRTQRGGLMQYESRDGGATWRSIGRVDVSDGAADVSPWLEQDGDTTRLLYAGRGGMAIYSSVATVGSKSISWAKPDVIYVSRLASRHARPSGNFGYPSVAHLTLNGTDTSVVVLFDSSPSDEFLGTEKDPANADLILVPLRSS